MNSLRMLRGTNGKRAIIVVVVGREEPVIIFRLVNDTELRKI